MPDLLERRSLREGITDPDWETRATSTVSPSQLSLVGYRAAPRQITLPFLNGKLLLTCDSPIPAWLLDVVAKLDELATLQPNWNSYRATSVRGSCLLAAVQLLLDIMQESSPAPAVIPTNHGTVLLEWHRRGIDLEIEVLGPGRFHVVAEDASLGTEVESDIDSDLTEIVRYIERLS